MDWKTYTHNYYLAHKEEILIKAKERNKDPIVKKRRRLVNNKWKRKNRTRLRIYNRRRWIINLDKVNAYQRNYRQKLRTEMISAYGGKCTCCSESIYEFLTLEHLNNDGSQHRKNTSKDLGCLLDLKKRGWPKDGYTVLCMNCNFAKKYKRGCPHRTVQMNNVG